MLVIATAEPFGAYHLTPFAGLLPADTRHLIGAPEGTHGEPLIAVTSDLSVLDRADALILTGGMLSAWTESLAREANRRGIPLILTELAYTSASPALTIPPVFDAVLAATEAGRQHYATYLGMNPADIPVTGYPHLDDAYTLPDRPHDRPASVLLTSSVGMTEQGSAHILALADRIATSHYLRVRTHPRENPEPWKGYLLSHGTLADDVTEADVVVGIPGTASDMAVLSGRPFLPFHPIDWPKLPAQFDRYGPEVTLGNVLARIANADFPPRALQPAQQARRTVADIWKSFSAS